MTEPDRPEQRLRLVLRLPDEKQYAIPPNWQRDVEACVKIIRLPALDKSWSMVLGRSDFDAGNPLLSRRQIKISYHAEDRNVVLEGQRSQNGTLLNRRKILDNDPHILKEGDEICLSAAGVPNGKVLPDNRKLPCPLVYVIHGVPQPPPSLPKKRQASPPIASQDDDCQIISITKKTKRTLKITQSKVIDLDSPEITSILPKHEPIPDIFISKEFIPKLVENKPTIVEKAEIGRPLTPVEEAPLITPVERNDPLLPTIAPQAIQSSPMSAPTPPKTPTPPPARKPLIDSIELECSICCDILSVPILLPCEHCFCHSCITGWFGKKNSCPNCQKLVDPKTVIFNRILAKVLEEYCREHMEKEEVEKRQRALEEYQEEKRRQPPPKSLHLKLNPPRSPSVTSSVGPSSQAFQNQQRLQTLSQVRHPLFDGPARQLGMDLDQIFPTGQLTQAQLNQLLTSTTQMGRLLTAQHTQRGQYNQGGQSNQGGPPIPVQLIQALQSTQERQRQTLQAAVEADQRGPTLQATPARPVERLRQLLLANPNQSISQLQQALSQALNDIKK